MRTCTDMTNLTAEERKDSAWARIIVALLAMMICGWLTNATDAEMLIIYIAMRVWLEVSDD